MAFRLHTDESVAHGLRRLATMELAAARKQLRRKRPPPEESIHEARKSLKKVRAIVDLIEADSGRGVAGVRRRVRKVNRLLSSVRDADAILEVLAKLRAKNAHVFDDRTYDRLRRRLLSNKERALKAARQNGAWEAVDRDLKKLRGRVSGWRPFHRHFGALAPGIEQTYRAGREALARARRRERAADYHEWRKELKALWYQWRLVADCLPAGRTDIARLHRAEGWLGDDHNLVVLCETLSKGEPLCNLEKLRHAANRFQCELRRSAVTATSRLYRSRPDRYVRRVKRAWNAAAG